GLGWKEGRPATPEWSEPLSCARIRLLSWVGNERLTRSGKVCKAWHPACHPAAKYSGRPLADAGGSVSRLVERARLCGAPSGFARIGFARPNAHSRTAHASTRGRVAAFGRQAALGRRGEEDREAACGREVDGSRAGGQADG